MARFYADEKYRYPIVLELRRRGHDVLTCQGAGRGGLRVPDDEVLADAAHQGRILLTHYGKDFKPLHDQGQPHSGILHCSLDLDTERQVAKIEAAIAREEPDGRWIVRVTRG